MLLAVCEGGERKRLRLEQGRTAALARWKARRMRFMRAMRCQTTDKPLCFVDATARAAAIFELFDQKKRSFARVAERAEATRNPGAPGAPNELPPTSQNRLWEGCESSSDQNISSRRDR